MDGAERLIVDGDGHVLEPDDLWERYLEPAFQDRRPRIVPDSRGFDRIMVESQLLPIPEGPGCGPPEGLDSGRLRPGAYDPEARIKDMDAEGIDIAVLFAGVAPAAAYNTRDPELAAAVARAYNRWLGDYCAHAPNRLKHVACVPLQHTEAAVAELRRSVREHDSVAVQIPSNTGGRNLDHPQHFPFFEAAAELGVAVSVHAGAGVLPVTAGTDRTDNFLQVHVIAHAFEEMLAVLAVSTGGVLARLPELRVLFLEAGCGWVPYWVERIDGDWEKRRELAPHLDRPPSEYLYSEQCWFSFEIDEHALPYALDVLGEERLIFASDYPHWDATLTGVVAEVSSREDISEHAKTLLLGENALRAFHIER